MLDKIIDELKLKVGSELMDKVGLDQSKTDASMAAAGESVSDVIGGGDGLDMGDVLNLFSNGSNSSGADALAGKLGSDYLGKLTNKVGLSPEVAASVKAMVIPALVSLLQNKVGGDKNVLASMLGGAKKDLASGLSGKLGGFGKMFK